MIDKVQKIREEVERLKEETSIGLSEHENGVEQGRMEIINALSLFLDSLQEEPVSKEIGNYDHKAVMEALHPELKEDNVSTSIDFEQELYKNFGQVKDFTLTVKIAKKFYEMGMKHQEPDPYIQYASREDGIKAHAEDYSFNIESELFQQLNKEQQELWRKEIEQAVLSGGYCGLGLISDKRYDKKEPVSEDLEEAAKEWLAPQLDKSYTNYGEVKMMELTHFDGYAMLDAIEFGAWWQKEQMMAKAIDAHCFGFQGAALFSFRLPVGNYLVGSEVKVIVMKED